MPERPDLRTIAGNIREALEDYDRESLIDILTYVFKEYVVEGPPPILVNQVERIPDLEGKSFAELVTALQTRLDLVELSLFKVDGDQVSVRAGGVMTPLGGPTGRAVEAFPPLDRLPASGDGEGGAARPQPGVRVVETELTRRPPAAGSPDRASVGEAVARGRADLAGLDQRRGVTPRPSGLSVRGRPSAGAMAPPAPGEASGQTEQPKPPEPAAEPAADGDDASVRFSLLELD